MKNNRKASQSAKRSRASGKASTPVASPAEVVAAPAVEPVVAPVSPAVEVLPPPAEVAVEAVAATEALKSAASLDLPAEPLMPTPVAASVVGVDGGPAEGAPVITVSPGAVVSAANPVERAAGDLAPRVMSASKRTQAEQIVRDYVPLAVGAGLIPVPGADLAAIGGLQLKVLAALAEHYGVAFTRAQAQLIVTSLLGSVGTTVLAGTMFLSLAKVVPGIGALLGAASLPLAGGAITHAMGQLAIDHFEAGGTLETFDLDVAQRAFAEKVRAAKAALA